MTKQKCHSRVRLVEMPVRTISSEEVLPQFHENKSFLNKLWLPKSKNPCKVNWTSWFTTKLHYQTGRKTQSIQQTSQSGSVYRHEIWTLRMNVINEQSTKWCLQTASSWKTTHTHDGWNSQKRQLFSYDWVKHRKEDAIETENLLHVVFGSKNFCLGQLERSSYSKNFLSNYLAFPEFPPFLWFF